MFRVRRQKTSGGSFMFCTEVGCGGRFQRKTHSCNEYRDALCHVDMVT